jgi:hypothetical protein
MFLLRTLLGVSSWFMLVQQRHNCVVRLTSRPTCVRAYIAASEACSDSGLLDRRKIFHQINPP